MPEYRSYAVAVLLIVIAATYAVCRILAAHVRKPAAAWAAGAYWAFLHFVCIYGLVTSTRFDTALAQLSLLTFPFSMFVGDTLLMQGFGTLPDLATNYVRYVVCFGGLNTLLIAAWLTLVAPRRAVRRAGAR